MMRVRERLVNPHQERQLFKARTWILAILMLVGTGILLAQLTYLQVVQYDKYLMLSENNRSQTRSLPPLRGEIFDCKGRILAQNVATLSLEIQPAKVKNLEVLLEDIAQMIVITEDEKNSFRKRWHRRWAMDKITLKHNLTEEEVAILSLHLHDMPEIAIGESYTRHYPLGAAMAHVIGYVSKVTAHDNQQADPISPALYIGKTGIERFYEETLRGCAGNEQIETNAKGKVIRTLNREEAIPGGTLYLSIDSALQKATYAALKDFKGAAVVMRPQSGEILALVSTPSFDPNLFPSGVSNTHYQALMNDPQSPMFNRAIQGQYPPASIIKPMLALAGLNTRKITPEDKLYDPGWYKLPNSERIYRDWKRSGHGWTDLNKALTESCDTYFYHLSHRLGVDNLEFWLKNFNFGSKTTIDLPLEAPGLVPSAEWKRASKNQAWYPGDTLNLGIGQGYMLSTPIQMACATSMIATRGRLMQPHIVTHIAQPNQTFVKMTPFAQKHMTLDDPSYWEPVIQGMRNAVHAPGGTAYRVGRTTTFEMAGKTGTAQVYSLKKNEVYNRHKVEEHLRDHAIFVAFAPVENPQVALAVVIENNIGSALIARNIIHAYFKEYPLEKHAAHRPS